MDYLMGREVKRVPLDFDHPLNKAWPGFLLPEKLREESCPDCTSGYGPEAERLAKLWYGDLPFRAEDNGSVPFASSNPVIAQLAERNAARWPECTPDAAREARRLANLFNSAWCHHLNQADVDALIAADRLWDFTRRFDPSSGWVQLENPRRPTAHEVNLWSLSGIGHDAINQHYVIIARCEREGIAPLCSTCHGRGLVEAYPGQRVESDAWEPTPPPTGEGWQLWETTSEGSPITKVYATAEALAEHWARTTGLASEDALRWVKEVGWAPSAVFVR